MRRSMSSDCLAKRGPSIALASMLLLLPVLTGCQTFTFGARAIPATRLPADFAAPSKAGWVTLDLAMLGQPEPKIYKVGPGDTLGVYIRGILPEGGAPGAVQPPPPVQLSIPTTPNYYPQLGQPDTPNFGIAFKVRDDGTIDVPTAGEVQVSGLSVAQVEAAIQRVLVEKEVVTEKSDFVTVSLLKSRTTRVVVIREDTSLATRLRKDEVPYTKKGEGQIIDLPAYENDVLHALAASDGLPGLDAYNEIWVLRSQGFRQETMEAMLANPSTITGQAGHHREHVIRIPLRLNPCEGCPFSPADVVLHEGDVIYIPNREAEVFYTGGVLPGGKIPMPRDQDLDVLEAIALVNGSLVGPGNNQAVFRTGPGNVNAPSRAVIIRKLANGQQVTIRVDLGRAIYDKRERILMQPDDQLLVFYKPSELYANIFLNYVGFNFNFNKIID